MILEVLPGLPHLDRIAVGAEELELSTIPMPTNDGSIETPATAVGMAPPLLRAVDVIQIQGARIGEAAATADGPEQCEQL